MTKTSVFFLALAGAAFLACGDDHGGDVDADPGPDIDAGTATPDASLASSTAFLVAGDFGSGTGIASTIDIPALTVNQNVVAGVASDDPALRYEGGKLYIINRFGRDNITILDAATLTFEGQVSTGAGSNPQDVAARGSNLYVAALAAPGVLKIDAQGAIEIIDLSALDENDGIPDCSSIYRVGSTLVVTCGILDNFVPAGPGKVAFIDSNDDTIIDVLDLGTDNPFGFIQPAGGMLDGELLVPTVTFGADLLTGCVERISVAPAPSVAGCLVENSDLGGYASGLAYGPDDTLYIAVTEGWDANGVVSKVVTYDVAAGQVGQDTLTPPEQRIFDVAHCPTGEWLFADGAGGIRVYDAEGSELTSDLLDIGLPPTGNAMVCY